MKTIAPVTWPGHAPAASPRDAGPPPPGVYIAAESDIVVELTARTCVAVPVRMRLDGFEASLVVEDDLGASWARVDLDPASVRSGVGLRDFLLRGPSVLDVGSYGVIRVESVEITRRTGLHLQVQADVYVKDLVTELPIDVRLVVPDPDTVLVAARTSIDRAALELALPPPWDQLVFRRVDVRAAIALHRGSAHLEVPS